MGRPKLFFLVGEITLPVEVNRKSTDKAGGVQLLKQFLRRILTKKDEEPIWEENEDHPGKPPTGTLLITREKILLGMFRDGTEIVQDILKNGGVLRLALEDDLKEDLSPEIFFSIKEFVLNIEKEAPEILALLDWQDPPTQSIYQYYLLPKDGQEQIPFVQQRIYYIYETCELLNRHYREIAEAFVASLGLYLEDGFFVQFEMWVKENSREYPCVDVETFEKEEDIPDLQLPIRLQFSREEVERMDITKIVHVLESLLQNPQIAREKKGSILFSFYGFSGVLENLLHLPEVQSWARFLVEKYPYFFYFLNDEELPMTRFLTSLVVSSHMRGDDLYYDKDEMEDFLDFIYQSLCEFGKWVGENPDDLFEEFHYKMSRGEFMDG